MEPRSVIRGLPANINVEFDDDDLCHRISNFLGSRHFPAFRNLLVQVDNGYVKVSGEVNSYYEKQVALTSCRRVAGVIEVTDDVEVVAKPPSSILDEPHYVPASFAETTLAGEVPDVS